VFEKILRRKKKGKNSNETKILDSSKLVIFLE